MDYPLVLSAVRTPLGRRDGALAGMHPASLLGLTQKAALDAAQVPADAVGQVVAGCVGQVGEQSFNIGRTAWLSAGLPPGVAATTVDTQCGSSQQAVSLASALVAAGTVEVAVACGVESMSRIPVGANFRRKHNLGTPIPQEYLDRYEFNNQFQAAEEIARRWKIERQRADEFGLLSQERAAAAWASGRFDGQVLSISTDHGVVHRDEGLRATDMEALAHLAPVIEDGIHTAGTSSQVSDGASAVVIASPAATARLGASPIARVVDSVTVGVDPVTMLLGPHEAVPQLLRRNSIRLEDVSLTEINEAFASVVLSWVDEMDIDVARVNPNGGAIAHGHPLGATGCVLTTKAVHGLRDMEGRFGLVTMCCGGGIGTATLLEHAS